MAIALIGIVTGLFNVIMKVIISKRVFGYSFYEQGKDNISALALSVIMGAIVYAVNLFELSSMASLSIQIPLGIAVYLLVSWIFKPKAFLFIIDIMNNWRVKEANV